MGYTKGSLTQMDIGIYLTISDEPCSEPYREEIGSLMYLIVGTIPDIAFPIGKLSKYVENPGIVHFSSVKRLLRYVIHRKTLGITYGGTNSSLTPNVYVDADRAGDYESRKSMSGCIVMMGGEAQSLGIQDRKKFLSHHEMSRNT